MRILIIFLATILSIESSAKSISDEIVDCVIKASSKYNVPSELILAIIDVESSYHPYAVNVAGKSLYFDNEDETLKKVRELGSGNKSFDVGLMQINRWWFELFKYPYEQGLDICFNINFGTHILAYEISRNGYNWEAIGEYHSKNRRRKLEYALKVWRKLKKFD